MSVTRPALEAYLHEHIPISRNLGVRVLAADRAGVRLAAPLAPNVNHRDTVFGGSLSAVAILAGWSCLRQALGHAGPTRRIVIQSNSIEYLAPANGDFEAWCHAPPPDRWAVFERTLSRRQRARITLAVDVTSGGEIVAKFHGQYVVLPDPGL